MPLIELSDKALQRLETLAKEHDATIDDVIDKFYPHASSSDMPESLYSAVFETAQQAILVVGKDSTYIDANPTACELLGYTRDELLTLTPNDILAEQDTRHQSVQERFNSNGYANSIYRLRKKNGQLVFAEFSAVANVVDGIHVAYVRDMTHFIHTMENLEESERYVEAIYTDTNIPIFSVNVSESGEFSYHELSTNHLKYLRKTREEVINKHPSQIDTINAEDAKRLVANYRRCYDEGKTITYEELSTIKGKTTQWLTRLTPLRDNVGRIYRLVGVSFNLSDKLALEREQLRAEVLGLELAKANELSMYKAEVASMLAHEFQTPLSVINTSIYLLRKSITTVTQKMLDERLKRIDRQVTLLRSLMERMISLNYGAVMRQDLQLASVNFAPFIQNIIDDLTMSFPDSSPIEFIYDLDTIKILTDEELMRQIITNLVSNAMKYTSDNSPVQIRCSGTKNYFNIVVADKGMGIPESELETIFDFFQRGTNVENRQGIGVGLMVVQQAVNRLGGKIVVSSQEGQGTTVTVTLSAKAIQVK